MTTASEVSPRVDAEFRDLIPPLREEERRGLEGQILAEGCRDPLVVWKEEGVLLDGHNRLSICEKHGIGYRTKVISLPDREAARDWIEANALNRRNLTPDQLRILRGRRYNRAKKGHGGKREASRQNGDLPERTSERLGKEHGVSARTIERDGAAAASIQGDADLTKEVVSGNLSLHEAARRSEIKKKVSALPADEQDRAKAFLESVVSDGNPSKVAVEMAENLIDMPQEERSRIYVLNESEDDRERELARTEAARLPPMPHPAVVPIRTALDWLNRAARMVDGDAASALDGHRSGLRKLVEQLKEAS